MILLFLPIPLENELNRSLGSVCCLSVHTHHYSRAGAKFRGLID
jgi:hypothetical protein